MSEIKILSVKTKSDLNEFLKMQWEFYKGDKYWVPPLLSDKKKLLDKNKNPFFQNAEMEMYIAKIDGKPVGRIAAIKNDEHNRIHNENIGFFGFFESINDQVVADKLLDTANDWLKSKGLDAMRGPANPSSNDDWGLLIDGFDDSPRFMMTYNPKYYITLFESYGLKKVKDLFAWKIENEKITQSDKINRVSELVRKRYGLKIKSIDMKNFKSELEKVKYVYNKAWAPNWGFIPMTSDEIDHLANDLKMIVEPSLVLFGEIKGETVGFALVMPDYNFIFKEMNGRLLPFNWIKMFTMKRKIPWARIITLGIIPEYQKKGIDGVFYYEITKRAAEIGILLGEASWVLEDNDMMNRGAEAMNAHVYKTYRIYEKPIK